MNLQTPVGPHDERSVIYNSIFQDADAGFVGVDEKTPPQWLGQGWAAQARNKRFRLGRAQDRGGIVICRWGKGDGTAPFGEVYGAVVYGSPGGQNTLKWILIAADGGVWKTRPGNVATPVPLPAGVVLTADSFTMFVQCMNVVVLLRGENFPPLAMADIDLGFQTIAQTAAGIDQDTTPIPNSAFGAYVLNRLALVQGRDFLATSDIGDYTSYQEVTETFQINAGDADSLVAFELFNENELVCLKSNSVYLVTGVSGNLSSAAGPFKLTDEWGCVAPLTVVVRGTNVYWLAQPGLASVTLTVLNETQATSQMLTDSIPKTFARINPLYVSGACGEIWKNRYYLGVPLDDAVIRGTTPLPYTFSAGEYQYTVQPGATYYWQPNGPGETLTVHLGALVLSGPGYFTAALPNEEVFVTGAPSEGYSSEITLATVGVNTGVLVYDFVNSAWCGSDESAATCPVQFIRYTYNGDEALLAVCADGFIRQWDVGSEQSPRAEDEIYAKVPTPYIDVILNGLGAPHAGDVISFAGVSLTVTGATTNTATTWGTGAADNGAANLWSDGTYGFDPALAHSWSNNLPGDFTALQITGGVRLNDLQVFLPITVNGIKVTNGAYLFADYFSGLQIQAAPVQSSLTTRAYSCLDRDGKRFITLLALCATWQPEYSITTIVNGANQTTAYVTDVTKDRTLYDVQDLGPYAVSNVNGDHAVAKRLDYSVCPDDEAMGGAGINFDAGPVNPDLAQDTIERLSVDEKGLWMQVQFNNLTGTHEVKAMLMEVLKADRESGAHV